MNDPMKILVAYDGSVCANNALYDLAWSGLPENASVRVLTVIESWVPLLPTPGTLTDVVDEEHDAGTLVKTRTERRQDEAADEGERLVTTAARRLREQYPGWQVEAHVSIDSPALGILRMADLWEPDLIVVGSHGRSAFTRVLLGSVSQKVLTEAHSSVRIARRHSAVKNSPVRIIIGTDGTPDADAAVRTVAARPWPEGSMVRLVSAHRPLDMDVDGPVLPYASYENFSPSDAITRRYARLAGTIRTGTEMLQRAGLKVTGDILEGAPTPTLLREAEQLGADSIFVGARGHGFFERFLLGSVSSAVASRAHCSVEVVRSEQGKKE